MNKKIIDIEELSKKLKEIRIKRKMTIGLSHGVFDLVHLGHIFHFNEAKKKVDILIVSVTSDKYVFKGPGRPFFSQEQRMEVISNLESVDYVTLSDSDSSLNIINSVKPNIYFKGPDYKDNSKDFTKKIIQENNLVKKNTHIIKLGWHDEHFSYDPNKGINFWKVFYQQANLDYTIKFKHKSITRNSKREEFLYNMIKKNYGENYIFTHDHRSYDYKHYDARRNVYVKQKKK